MKSTIRKLFNFINGWGDNAYIIYPVMVLVFASFVVEHLMFLCLIPIEGSSNGVRTQILNMCGSAWWGGVNMVNYYLEPTPGDCNGYQTTYLGFWICLSFSTLIIQIIKNWALEIKFAFSIKKTILYLLGGIGCVIIYRLMLSSGSKYYWGPNSSFFIDMVVYIFLLLMVIYRTIDHDTNPYKKTKTKTKDE
tara:strand:+ start:775 stop:1350 length:576 start_codon:yes stop_codon:yes gene_type:complete